MALSLGGTPGEGILMRPSGPCSLNQDHPVPQRLTIHATDHGKPPQFAILSQAAIDSGILESQLLSGLV